MDIDRILHELRSERDRLDRAIAALQGAGAGGARRNGRTAAAAAKGGRRRGPRHMSADARRRISEAMRKRWAERKKRSS